MANVLLHTDVKTDAKTNLNVLMRKICDLMGQKTSPVQRCGGTGVR